MWLQTSDDLVREHAYLIARRVRPLAIVGQCAAERLPMLQASTRLEALGCTGAIPFVVDRGDGVAEFGYAARGWALDLYRWLSDADENAVPAQCRHRILALLLGYGADAVHDFEEQGSGLTFAPTALASRVAK
jgi:hypothetical protein